MQRVFEYHGASLEFVRLRSSYILPLVPTAALLSPQILTLSFLDTTDRFRVWFYRTLRLASTVRPCPLSFGNVGRYGPLDYPCPLGDGGKSLGKPPCPTRRAHFLTRLRPLFDIVRILQLRTIEGFLRLFS